jgi:hypothetical protein
MIALLTSGATLGTHVPAVILARRLRDRGVDATVEVFERLLKPKDVTRLRDAKPVLRNNFKMAVAAQRLARDQSDALDAEAVEELLDRWRRTGIRAVVLFSGFWVPIVERYDSVPIEVCHLDAAATASFGLFEERMAQWRHRWLFDAEADTVNWTVPVSPALPISWEQREPRVLAHGGGWGVGDYRDRARDLLSHGFAVDIVVHDWASVGAISDRCRYYLIDPEWEAWHDAGLPPFGLVGPDHTAVFTRGGDHHDSYDIASRSLAMISKTGGATLVDSLWAATPIVTLEPFGAHEQVNARLWQRLGFGVPYQQWADAGHPVETLERLHHNLVRARRSVADYGAVLAAGPQ